MSKIKEDEEKKHRLSRDSEFLKQVKRATKKGNKSLYF